MTENTNVATSVEVMLAERDVRYERRPGPTFAIPHGSAEIVIEFDDLAGGNVIQVSAIVLDEIELAPEAEEGALRAVNDRNRSLRFGKFVLHEGARKITLEYDLLADFLQPEELMNAVSAVAQMADEHDDLLGSELGSGRRAVDRVG